MHAPSHQPDHGRHGSSSPPGSASAPDGAGSGHAGKSGRRAVGSDKAAGAPPVEPVAHLGPRQDDVTRRERFDSRELAIVLSHYELGVIESIRDYPRGSRRAPKVRIRTQTGEYLLKRRAPGRDEPHRVAFSHRLQLHLAENNFPVARLIGTRDSNNSMVQHNGAVYEMFEYVRGEHYNGSNRATQYAGYTLAHLHRLLGGHALVSNPPDASYHAAPGLAGHIAAVPRAVSTVDVKASEADLLRACAYLRQAYDDAVHRVESLGYSRWTRVINHGDWHPGNLLFHPDRRVAGVIDFDSARLEPRMADVANGALQFAMRIGRNTDDPSTWPDALSAERIRAFVRGYDQGAANPLTDAEHQSLPWLIIEALIAESAVPIAATGSFARIPGAPFLAMIERKVQWLTPRSERLVTFVRESRG